MPANSWWERQENAMLARASFLLRSFGWQLSSSTAALGGRIEADGVSKGVSQRRSGMMLLTNINGDGKERQEEARATQGIQEAGGISGVESRAFPREGSQVQDVLEVAAADITRPARILASLGAITAASPAMMTDALLHLVCPRVGRSYA